MSLFKKLKGKISGYVKREKLFLIIVAILLIFSSSGLFNLTSPNLNTTETSPTEESEVSQDLPPHDEATSQEGNNISIGTLDIILFSLTLCGYGALKIYKKRKEKSHE